MGSNSEVREKHGYTDGTTYINEGQNSDLVDM